MIHISKTGKIEGFSMAAKHVDGSATFTADVLCFPVKSGGAIELHPDGKVIIPEGVELDDAAAAFWDALKRHVDEKEAERETPKNIEALKSHYKTQRTELNVLRKERRQLLAGTERRYLDLAKEVREWGHDILRLEPETPVCMSCGQLIFQAELCYSRKPGLNECSYCAPTYRRLMAEPYRFWRDDGERYTQEWANSICRLHLNSHGKADDLIPEHWIDPPKAEVDDAG